LQKYVDVEGPQFFGCSRSAAPSNFGPKRCFWQATSRTQVV